MNDPEMTNALDYVTILSAALAYAINSGIDRIDISGLADLIKVVNPTAEVREGIKTIDGESLTMALHNLKSLTTYIH